MTIRRRRSVRAFLPWQTVPSSRLVVGAMRARSRHSVKVAGIVARSVPASPVLVILGEPRSFAVLLSFIVLLAVLDEAALSLQCRPFAFALDDVLDRLSRRRFVQLLDEARVRTRPVLSLGMQRSRVSTLAHVHMSSRIVRPGVDGYSTPAPWYRRHCCHSFRPAGGRGRGVNRSS